MPEEEKQGPTPIEWVYLHSRCSGVTSAPYHRIRSLANPFSLVSSAFCAQCQRYVDLETVAWLGTGEPISAYRRRMRREAPPSLKLCCWVYLPLVSALAGALLAWRLSWLPLVTSLLAGFAAGMLSAGYLIPGLAWRMWGIDYSRKR